MAYYPGYGYPLPPQAPQERKKSWKPWVALGYIVFIIAAAVGALVYQALERLSDQVLTVIATVACAGGVALPGVILSLAVLLRWRENGKAQAQVTAAMTPPQVVVIPPIPMVQPPANLLPPGGNGGAVVEQVPAPRRFTVLGDD